MRPKYEVVIYWSEDERETYEAALQNAQVIIEEWIETAKSLGRPIPQQKGRLKSVV